MNLLNKSADRMFAGSNASQSRQTEKVALAAGREYILVGARRDAN